MQGSNGGPVSAGTISSQAGLGSPSAPYTGLPGYTDKVYNPFDPMNSQSTPAQPQDYSAQEEKDNRSDRRYKFQWDPNSSFTDEYSE